MRKITTEVAMIIKKTRRRHHLCSVVVVVLFIVLMAARIPELVYRFRTTQSPEQTPNANFRSRHIQSGQGPSSGDGIPYVLRALHSYFEPHSYRIRQVSATEIVGVIGRHLDTASDSHFTNPVVNLKTETHNVTGVIKSNKRFSNIERETKQSFSPESRTALPTIKTNETYEPNTTDVETSIELVNETVAHLNVSSLETPPEDLQAASRVFTPYHLKKHSSFIKSNGIQNDPLVIVPRPDSHLKRVSFPFSQNGSYWSGRPLTFTVPGQQDVKDEQYQALQQAVWSGGWNITNLAEYSLEQVMQPWEWDIYKDPPLSNIKETVDELFSKVELLNSTRSFTLGESVAVRVDLYDGYGRARTKGGDDLRVWLREDAAESGLAVKATDLHNGSYIATIPLLFEGSPKVKVSVTYPREIRRVVFYLRNIMKGMRLNVGGFVSEFASEATICSPFPISGGYPELCNLTSLNYNLSWFCGRPYNPVLKCRHWQLIRDLEFPNPLPVTKAEKQWFDRLGFGRRHHLRLVNNPNIDLTVRAGPSPVVNPFLACNERPLRDSWTQASPSGFVLRGQWKPTGCTIPHMDINTINKCLNGSTLYMVGDSNLRHMLEMIVYYGLCTPVTELLGKLNWHSPQLCINHQYKYLVRWRTHALPFHTNTDHWAPRINQQSVGLSLDEIPATGKYFVLLHMYLHFTTHHYSVYIQRVRAMRDAVERLLVRNPQVKVVIRGPHAAFKGWSPMLGGDAHAQLYLDILKREFKHLYDKVLLLDFWDMTVAWESEGFHPEAKITQQMIRVLFGHVCG